MSDTVKEKGIFRDWIPEGEDPGAVGSGFKDFVPTPEPKPEPVVEEIKPIVEPAAKTVAKPVKKAPAKKGAKK